MVLPVCMFILDAARFWELANTGGSSEARDGDKDEKEGEPLNGEVTQRYRKRKTAEGQLLGHWLHGDRPEERTWRAWPLSHWQNRICLSLHVGCLLTATKGPFDSMTPCLTRSALIKSSPESRRRTDTNLLQKTTQNPVNTHASVPVSRLSSVNKLASV